MTSISKIITKIFLFLDIYEIYLNIYVISFKKSILETPTSKIHKIMILLENINIDKSN